MEDLRARKRSLDAELKDTKKKLKEAKRQVAREEKQWSLRGQELNVTMCIYMMTDCSLEPTAIYVRGVASKHDWPERSNDDIHLFIIDTFANASFDFLVTLLDEDCDETFAARKEARKYVLEWCVVEWGRAQNTKDPDPVEPSTGELLDQLELIRLSIPENERPRAWGVSASGSARKRASRLRAKYGGRIGKLRSQVRLPVAEMREKSMAAWQWYNHLASKVPHNKKVLRVNLDETAICLFPGNRGGNLFVTKAEEPTVNVKQSVKRTYLTHVAIVCDDADLQKLLPQVIIGIAGDRHRVI